MGNQEVQLVRVVTNCKSGQRSVVQDLPFYQTPEGKDDLLPPRLSSEGARVDPALAAAVPARPVAERREDAGATSGTDQ